MVQIFNELLYIFKTTADEEINGLSRLARIRSFPSRCIEVKKNILGS